MKRRSNLTRGMEIFLLTAISIIALIALILEIRSPIISKENQVRDYSHEPVTWTLIKDKETYTYRLTRPNSPDILAITCRNGKLMVPDLKTMSIVYVIDKRNGNTYPIYNIGIDGSLYQVPVINDNPNPTIEQIEFLKSLSIGRFITYEFNKVRHSWPTENQTELSHCLDKD